MRPPGAPHKTESMPGALRVRRSVGPVSSMTGRRHTAQTNVTALNLKTAEALASPRRPIIAIPVCSVPVTP